MYSFIIGLVVFLSILLVLVILAQNAKGGGLSSQFGGSSASNLIGVKKTGDLLEKMTWGLSISIMVLALLSTTSFISPTKQRATNPVLEDASQQRQTSPSVGTEIPPMPSAGDTTGN